MLYALVIPASWLGRLFLIRKDWACLPFVMPLLYIGRVYSKLTGFGLLAGLCVYFAYMHIGWYGIVLYVVSNGVRIFLDARVEERLKISSIKIQKPFLMYDPYCFLLAFKHYARAYNKNDNICKSEKDIMAGKILLQEFIQEYPIVARRFVATEGFALPRC